MRCFGFMGMFEVQAMAPQAYNEETLRMHRHCIRTGLQREPGTHESQRPLWDAAHDGPFSFPYPKSEIDKGVPLIQIATRQVESTRRIDTRITRR